MSLLTASDLQSYWSHPVVTANILVVLNLLGALALGMVVGFERSYRGRAAGMRTYGLVCMVSAALTVMVGYSHFWYGGQAMAGFPDPTRVVQGIVTGLGFLGAGVIMKDGFNISGLSTAASLWAACAIGVLIGVGFYAAAILMAGAAALSMAWVSHLEAWLPSHPSIVIVLKFARDHTPQEDSIRRAARDRGYDIAPGSLSITCDDTQLEWRFTAIALSKEKGAPISQLADELSKAAGVIGFSVAHARN
jgi:putative Mg2+ transporter-C (MgtC) family protein